MNNIFKVQSHSEEEEVEEEKDQNQEVQQEDEDEELSEEEDEKLEEQEGGEEQEGPIFQLEENHQMKDGNEEEEEEDMTELYFKSKRALANSKNDLINLPIPINGMICSTAIYKNRYLFMGTSQFEVWCYDLKVQKIIYKKVEHDDWVLSLLVISLQGVDLLLSGAGLYDRSINFYQLKQTEKNKLYFQIEAKNNNAHYKSITKMHFIEKNDLLLTCGSDFRFKVWKLSWQLVSNESKVEEVQKGFPLHYQEKKGIEQLNFSNTQDLVPQKKLKMEIVSVLLEVGQIYSVCESDDNLVAYGTGNGLIKVISINNKGKAKELKYLNVIHSVWCMERFTHLRYIIGYSFQAQGRVSIVNVITGQHLFNVFDQNDHIHSFQIIYKQSRIFNKQSIVQNKKDFLEATKNCVTIIGLSKQNMIKVHNLGEGTKSVDNLGQGTNSKEFFFQCNQNMMWIPWKPIVIIPKEKKIDSAQDKQDTIPKEECKSQVEETSNNVAIDEEIQLSKQEEESTLEKLDIDFDCEIESDEEPFEEYKILCSTGKSKSPNMVSIDWCV